MTLGFFLMALKCLLQCGRRSRLGKLRQRARELLFCVEQIAELVY